MHCGLEYPKLFLNYSFEFFYIERLSQVDGLIDHHGLQLFRMAAHQDRFDPKLPGERRYVVAGSIWQPHVGNHKAVGTRPKQCHCLGLAAHAIRRMPNLLDEFRERPMDQVVIFNNEESHTKVNGDFVSGFRISAIRDQHRITADAATEPPPPPLWLWAHPLRAASLRLPNLQAVAVSDRG